MPTVALEAQFENQRSKPHRFTHVVTLRITFHPFVCLLRRAEAKNLKAVVKEQLKLFNLTNILFAEEAKIDTFNP